MKPFDGPIPVARKPKRLRARQPTRKEANYKIFQSIEGGPLSKVITQRKEIERGASWHACMTKRVRCICGDLNMWIIIRLDRHSKTDA